MSYCPKCYKPTKEPHTDCKKYAVVRKLQIEQDLAPHFEWHKQRLKDLGHDGVNRHRNYSPRVGLEMDSYLIQIRRDAADFERIFKERKKQNEVTAQQLLDAAEEVFPLKEDIYLDPKKKFAPWYKKFWRWFTGQR